MRQFGKGIVAAAIGGGRGDQRVAAVIEAVAIAVLVEFDGNIGDASAAAGGVASAVIVQAIVVGIIPNAIAQFDIGPEAKVKGVIILTRRAGGHRNNGKVAAAHAVGIDAIGQGGATIHVSAGELVIRQAGLCGVDANLILGIG